MYLGRGRSYAYLVSMDWSTKMADEKQTLSIGDVDDVTGGTVEVTINKTKLRKIVVDAKHDGKTLDWVLQYCNTEEEREFVRFVWNGLA